MARTDLFDMMAELSWERALRASEVEKLAIKRGRDFQDALDQPAPIAGLLRILLSRFLALLSVGKMPGPAGASV